MVPDGLSGGRGHAPPSPLDSVAVELDDILAELDPAMELVPGGERHRRGKTNGPIRVVLPHGYLDDLDDLTPPDDADVDGAERRMNPIVPQGVEVVLASGLPRRDSLRQLGLDPIVVPADIDEDPLEGEDPVVSYVRRLADEKAAAVVAMVPEHDPRLVIAADTTIDLDGEILAKPLDPDDARSMLRRQSYAHRGAHRCGGAARRRHAPHRRDHPRDDGGDRRRDVGVVRGDGGTARQGGRLRVQGAGWVLVERVDGSVSNVVGLPLAPLVELIRQAV